MGHQVFISHSSKDKEYADAVCRSLESESIPCWIAPRDIRPGAEYAEGIITAIENSAYMVLVVSANANESPQVLREVERAVSKNVPIVPFRIDDVLLSKSLEYFISSHHWLDASTPPLEPHLATLAGTIRNYINQHKDMPMPQAPPHKDRPGDDAHSSPGFFSRRTLIWACIASFLILAILALLYVINPLAPSHPVDGSNAALWQTLASLDKDADGAIELSANQDSFTVGQAMELAITVPEDGFVNVLHMNEQESTATVLFPNRFHPDNRVEAGQVLAIPGPDDGYSLSAQPPLGLSQIVVLITSRPLNGFTDQNIPAADSVFAILKQDATRSFVVQATDQDLSYRLGRLQVMVTE